MKVKMILARQPSDAAVVSCQVCVRLCLVSGFVLGLETQGVEELGLVLISNLREFMISSKIGTLTPVMRDIQVRLGWVWL